MALLDVISKRYSVRAYEPREVEEEKLQTVLEAARLAPSARNFQEWRFVAVRDPGTRRQLTVAANNQAFVGQAPVIIVCCGTNADYVMRCGQLSYPIDLAIAIDHMTLQAVAEGLGTCWIGSFYEDQVRAILGIPDEVRIVSLLTLGYAADRPSAKNRVPLKEIVSRERWNF
ncbi:MAG: nitroreductase family protein [Kiritimatiellia bacterium]|nr:nitroreductase family protein [Lentisphaerota bacterium]